MDRSAPRARIAALHARPELPRRQPDRSGDRRAAEGGAGRPATRSRFISILGNLYREKGQVGRAIQEHQSLLQRPNLRKLEHANVLLCLGLDYRRGGFVDRASRRSRKSCGSIPRTSTRCRTSRSCTRSSISGTEAYATRQKLASLSAAADEAAAAQRDPGVPRERARPGGAASGWTIAEAARRFEAAIELDARNAPAHLSLGDVRFYQGTPADAIAAWERHDRGVAGARLPGVLSARRRVSEARRAGAVSRALRAADRRQSAGLARAARAGAASVRAAIGRRTRSSRCSRRSSTIRTRWRSTRRSGRRSRRCDLPPPLVDRYLELTRDAVFYLDPHVCVRCRYRSTELLWQCPQCHEWNTFVEERIAPAKERRKLSALTATLASASATDAHPTLSATSRLGRSPSSATDRSG